MMKAIVFTKYGSPDVLELKKVEKAHAKRKVVITSDEPRKGEER